MIALKIFLLISVSFMIPMLWIMYFGDLSISKFKAKMEKINIDHARDMLKIHGSISSLYTGNIFSVTYLVPVENQSLLIQRLNKIKIYPYTFTYNAAKSEARQENSRYTKIISKNKWFYMQLKNWSETNNREVALKAMKYLHWEQDIP